MIPTRRLAFFMLIAFALGSCDKKKAKRPSGPTKVEVLKEHGEAAKAQLENFRAVVAQAVKLKPVSVRELAKLDTVLSVDDLELATGKSASGNGNTRMVLFQKLWQMSTKDRKALDILGHTRAVYAMKLPRPPSNFLIDPSARIMLGWIAGFLAEDPKKDPDGKVPKSRIAQVEEFVRLKYLIILRTVAIKAPKLVAKNTYRPGIYGGEALFFNLEERKLVARLQILAKNREGKTSTGVDWNLSYEVRKKLDAIIKRAQRK